MAEGLGALKTAHLKCRVLRHAWEPVMTAIGRQDRKRVYITDIRCLRCKAESAFVLYTATKERERKGIHYPDGYLLDRTWGDRKTINANVTDELVTRLVATKNGKPKRGRGK